LIGGAGDDKLSSGAGDDYLDGGAGIDYMSGEAGNDRMFGGDGNDLFYGGDGDDLIHGDAGSDKLIGERGADHLWGGAASDWFIFKGAGALDGAVDRIEDFQDGSDLIVLEKIGVTHFAPGSGLGSIYAQDAADGGVTLLATTLTGEHLTISVADPAGNLSAANFSAADFLFV